MRRRNTSPDTGGVGALTILDKSSSISNQQPPIADLEHPYRIQPYRYCGMQKDVPNRRSAVADC
jgi:hypothetical protein